MKTVELIELKIKEGKEILQSVSAMRPSSGPAMNVAYYVSEDVDKCRKAIEKWQLTSKDILIEAFGETHRYVLTFVDTLSRKNSGFNYQREFTFEVNQGLSVLESVAESLHLGIGQGKEDDTNAEAKTPMVFISHSSKDSGIISRFVEQILRLGLGLAPEDIAFTSEETFGVEPGENIAKYIRDNICGAKVVLLMISSNYKASDICLNEMGAAWALGKKCISVVLPNADFSYLGWLSSLEKAVQLCDKSQLVSLSDKLAELLQIDLGKRFKSLSSGIDRFLSSNGTIATPKAEPVKNVHPTESSQVLKVFDVLFNSVCMGAGEYVIQINLRMRSDESNISLRRVFLRNKKHFTGTCSEAFKELEFKSYLDQDTINLTSLKKEDIAFWKKEYPQKCHQVIDVTIEKGHNLSLSFCEYFFTVRECDGYDELQLKGWSLVIQYNVDAEMIIPLELVPVDKVFAGKYWHN